jgi:hypothetical protein
MSNLELVVAELPDGTNNWMLNDKQCHVINDGALFLVTTQQNSKRYRYLEFFPVDDKVLVEMLLHFKILDNGKLLMLNYG